MRLPKREPVHVCWKVRVEGRERGRTFYQAYWTMAPRLGWAIERVLFTAAMCGIDEPIARAALPLDLLWVPEEDTWPTPIDEIRCAERYYFPLQRRFVPPCGVIESCEAHDLASTKMRTGFARSYRYGRGDLRVVVGCQQLEPVLANLIELLGRVTAVHVHHSPRCTIVPRCMGSTEHMRTPGAVIGFLSEHRESLLWNGYVSIHVWSKEFVARVWLDEHKEIYVQCESPRRRARVEQELKRQGVRQYQELLSVRRFRHHHFRPPGSFAPLRLGAMLRREGFRSAESWVLASV